MKKTLLAMAVTGLFATTAQAATVYEADGVTVNIYGDAEVQLISDIKARKGETEINKNYIEIDDADFGFGLAYDIGNGLKVGGTVEFSGEGGKVKLGDTFVGLKGGFGTITAGKQPTIIDDAGVGGDYKFGFDTFVSDAFDSGTQVIKYKGDWDTFYAGIAYMLNSDDNLASEDEAYTLDGNLGVRFAGVDATVFYSTGENAKNEEMRLVVLQAVYTMDSFNVGAFYSNGQQDDNKGKTTADADAYGLSANYFLNEWNFGLGWGATVDNKAAANVDDTNNTMYVNAGYSFTSNVHAYVELGYSDEDNTDMGYATGVKINF